LGRAGKFQIQKGKLAKMKMMALWPRKEVL